MSEMNFIPASMARHQLNTKILFSGGKALLVCSICLSLAFVGLSSYNKYLSDEVAKLTAAKNAINIALKERESQSTELKKIQNVAANLNQLNSFSQLSQSLNMLNTSIPDETALSTLQTEFKQSGDTLILLEGTADSHKNLTTWVSTLQTLPRVKSAELLSSHSIQSAAADQLKQKFSLQITQTTHGEESP